jgi:hypothetical protein
MSSKPDFESLETAASISAMMALGHGGGSATIPPSSQPESPPNNKGQPVNLESERYSGLATSSSSVRPIALSSIKSSSTLPLNHPLRSFLTYQENLQSQTQTQTQKSTVPQRKYEIKLKQQPVIARCCGGGDKDRRSIDPVCNIVDF